MRSRLVALLRRIRRDYKIPFKIRLKVVRRHPDGRTIEGEAFPYQGRFRPVAGVLLCQEGIRHWNRKNVGRGYQRALIHEVIHCLGYDHGPRMYRMEQEMVKRYLGEDLSLRTIAKEVVE